MRSNVLDLINESESIVLLTHETPDGDAIGSVMAFYYMLTSINKTVDIVIPDMPKIFTYLDSIDKIVDRGKESYDLAIVLDCASKERIGQVDNVFDKCKNSIVIDHHASNTKYGNVNYVEEETSACCQVIYYLFKDWNICIDKTMGEALTTGLLTDTAGFRNNNVDKNSFFMAADMLDLGVDIYKLYYLVLCRKTMPQHLLLKMTLDKLELLCDGKIAFSYVSLEDLENVGAKPGDHEGLVDFGRYINGVEVSIFMREDNGYRISFRSNGSIDVNNLASKFGGGGHKMAAGAKVNTSFKETKEALIKETIKALSE